MFTSKRGSGSQGGGALNMRDLDMGNGYLSELDFCLRQIRVERD